MLTFARFLCYLLIITSLNFFVRSNYNILTSPIKIQYDQYNSLKSIQIRFKTTTPLFTNDIMFLSFTQKLQTVPGNLDFSLTDQFGQFLANGMFSFITDANIATYNLNSFKNGASSSYICQFSQQYWDISATSIDNIWLTLIINFDSDLTQTFTKILGSVNIAIVSSLDPNHITYQSMNGFSYFHFTSLTSFAPPQLINVQIANNIYGTIPSQTVLSSTPAAIYSIFLELTPTIDYNDFFLNIQFTTLSLANLLAKTSLPIPTNDFQFSGTCSFICVSTIQCLNFSTCQLTSSKILVNFSSLQTLTAGQKYVLKFNVLNPSYDASTNLLLWVDDIGSASDMANIVGPFTSNKINIIADELRLFWRVPQIYAYSFMGFGFFVDGGINTIQVGFKLDNTSPFGQLNIVTIYVGSNQLIIQSVNHNLPYSDSTIYYEYVFPNLIIKNVSAFTQTNFRYWVSFRTLYASTDSLNAIGSVSIKSMQNPSMTLFAPLTINTVKLTNSNSDFHDYLGFHNPSIYKNYDTIVVTGTDNLLENATSEVIRKYFNEITAIGVDPTISNQQLLFLMNVPQAKMWSGSASETYEARVYFNPNIFQYVSDKGIDIIAYDSSLSKWETSANDCYRDQSLTPTTQTYMCQKYNDHVFNNQIDNTLQVQNSYSYYSYVCGAGTAVQCLDVSCKQECQLFKGLGTTTGNAGVAAIRNTTFIPNYQSPIQAGDKNFDFIVAFYHGGSLVSASLINAYTINTKPLKNLTVSLINTYHDGTTYNLGDRIPTLIKISSKLEYTEYQSLNYPDTIKVFTSPFSANFDAFIQNTNEIGCSYNCKLNGSLAALGIMSENWLSMHSIAIKELPLLTNSLNILIPIQIKSSMLSIFIGFESNGSITAIYRFGGSAYNQLLTSPINYLFQSSVYGTLWNLALNWVIAPAYTYLQAINLQQTNDTSTSNLVIMSGSTMPYHDNPYSTISISNLQILADSTQFIVGNSLINRTCDMLFYSYNQKSVQIGLCQLYTNVSTTDNNIKIKYPDYSGQYWLGPGFPYDQIFSYGYASEIDGRLQGYRSESMNKVGINLCTTSKATQYNIGQIGRQLQIYNFQIDPIILSSSTFPSVQIQLQIPNNIVPNQCYIKQQVFNSTINCLIVSTVLNVTIFKLSINPGDIVKLITFQLILYCTEIPTVTIAANSIYKISIILPHTDAISQKTIYGVSFSPFFSTAYSCSNIFSFINSAYDNTIVIESYSLNPLALNMNFELNFNITMNKQKGDLLASSIIEIQFTGIDVYQESYCYFEDFNHQFFISTFLTNKFILQNNQNLKDFTVNLQKIHCSNLILRSSTPTFLVRIKDVPAASAIILLSVATSLPVTLPLTGVSTTIVSSIPSKKYSTIGFNTEYSINFVLSGTGLVQGYIDVSDFTVDFRLLNCQLTITQAVFCKRYKVSNNLDLESRLKIIYFKTYFTSAFTSFTLKIYPIQSEQLISPKVFKTTILMNSNLYYNTLTDVLPNLVSNNPILIKKYSIQPIINASKASFDINVKYIMPVTIARPIYLKIDEILFFGPNYPNVTLICTINGTTVPCSILQKDLIFIDISSLTHTLALLYSMDIQLLDANYQTVYYDMSNFFIKMFIVDLTTFNVDYLSVIDMELQIAEQLVDSVQSYKNFSNMKYLNWNIKDGNNFTIPPKIYWGYYGNPIQLSVIDSTKFIQTMYLTSPTYSSQIFQCSLGITTCKISLIAPTNTTVVSQLIFSHNSTMYQQPFVLEVQISTQACVISTDFTNYKIFQLGVTLPIVLNFTKCMPAQPLMIVTSFNSSEVQIDTSLSQLSITSSNPIGIIVVKHASSNTALNSFKLSMSLTGTYASSFSIPSFVTIDKISRTQSSIQNKAPLMPQLTGDYVKWSVQCNQPSTIYWALGLYPSILGFEAQDIQTRLLDQQVGLKTYIFDQLNYGYIQYGLNYTQVPNVWKDILINNLRGNMTYTFKYFCQNIQGTYSGGKISTFTTPSSIYSLIKLTIGFPTPLTYMSTNNYACAITESLAISYSSVISSVNSNCKNNSLIFYKNYSDKIWNQIQQSNGSNSYLSIFYIDSLVVSSLQIASSVRSSLAKTSRIMLSEVPLWQSINIQTIDPDVLQPSLSSSAEIEISTNTVKIKFPIQNNQNSYIIVGLISLNFDSTIMSLPEPYLIKKGKFSDTVEFDKVYMNYTTSNKTFVFQNLLANTNYSIFYFVTVDDARIYAKSSSIQYVNLITASYLQVDLYGIRLNSLIITIMFIGWIGLNF